MPEEREVWSVHRPWGCSLSVSSRIGQIACFVFPFVRHGGDKYYTVYTIKRVINFLRTSLWRQHRSWPACGLALVTAEVGMPFNRL